MINTFLNTPILVLAAAVLISLVCRGSMGAAAADGVSNGGFEDGLANWSVPEKFKAQISLSKFNPHADQQCLRIDNKTQDNSLPRERCRHDVSKSARGCDSLKS